MNATELPKPPKYRTFTPENAKHVLDTKNCKNRSPSQARIKEYAQAMEDGLWEINGDALCFNEDGRLVDGQHRLLAVIKSGTTQTFLCAVDLTREAILTIDTGKIRSAGDTLAIEGLTNKAMANALATAISKLIIVESGNPIESETSLKSLRTNRRINEYYVDNRNELESSIDWVEKHGVKRRGLLQKSEELFCVTYFRREEWYLGAEFLKKLISGVGLREIEPARFLRDALQDMKDGHIQMTRAERFYSILKNWNYVKAGKRLKTKSCHLWVSKKNERVPYPLNKSASSRIARRKEQDIARATQIEL